MKGRNKNPSVSLNGKALLIYDVLKEQKGYSFSEDVREMIVSKYGSRKNVERVITKKKLQEAKEEYIQKKRRYEALQRKAENL